MAREAAGRERDDIGQSGRVDKARDEEDENVVREVAGQDEDVGQDIEDIDGGGIVVGCDRNHGWQGDVEGDEDNDMGVPTQTQECKYANSQRLSRRSSTQSSLW